MVAPTFIRSWWPETRETYIPSSKPLKVEIFEVNVNIKCILNDFDDIYNWMSFVILLYFTHWFEYYKEIERVLILNLLIFIDLGHNVLLISPLKSKTNCTSWRSQRVWATGCKSSTKQLRQDYVRLNNFDEDRRFSVTWNVPIGRLFSSSRPEWALSVWIKLNSSSIGVC